MKILIVTQYFWPENFRINDLCMGLKERGHEITIYTALPNYPRGKFFNGYGLTGPFKEFFHSMEVIRVPIFPRGKKKGFSLILNYLSYFVSASLLAPLLIKKKYDRIFVYEPSPITVAIPAILIKYLKKTPMILWVTDLWPESLEATGTIKNKKILALVGTMVRWIYQHTDKILITSQGFRKKIETYCENSSKIDYWPQWAEDLFVNIDDTEYEDPSFPTEGFKVVFAGNIGSAQDFETIIGAAKILQNYKGLHFVILGDGTMMQSAKKRVQDNSLEQTFHFLDRKPLKMMPYYFKRADALLLTLKNAEIFSLTIPSKLQSYLASGRPIVVGIDGVASDIIENWNAGASSKAGNPKSLSEAILKIYKSCPEERKRLGDNAFRCYQAEFQREKLITRLEQILTKLGQ